MEPQINYRVSGILLLLFAIIIPFSLKAFINNLSPLENLWYEKVFVQIEGSIRYPGVYSFCRKINLNKIIERGGGLKNNAAPPETFNNILIPSGVRVRVKRNKDEWRYFQDRISAFYKITLGIPISINRESEEGLMAIPGIGPKLAKIIIREKEKRGAFKNLNEIKLLYGIGNKKYKMIIPYVKL
ncbi:ComEA family DNA-binding protein [Thermodesulfobacteriota bacterium]